jgi:hypothetical protein
MMKRLGPTCLLAIVNSGCFGFKPDIPLNYLS